MPSDGAVIEEEDYDPNAALLEWSEGRPDWQRDLLRRLSISDSLNDESREQVIDFLLSEGQITDDNSDQSDDVPKPIPISIDHFPQLVDEGEKITLKKLSDLESAGVMAKGEVLEFDLKKSLHIIYGDNGSGKSGYSKILRRSTGSQLRNEPFIYGDVFDDNFSISTRASAEITISKTSDGKAKDTVVPWKDGDDTDPLISTIRVFDRNTAGISVSADCEVAVLPFSLNLLERLGEEQLSLVNQIEQLIQTNNNAMTAEWIGLDNDAVIICLNGELSANHTDDQIEKAILYEDKDEERLVELSNVLNAGNAAILLNSRRLNSLDKLEKQLAEVSEIFSKSNTVSINEQIAVYKAAEEAISLLGVQTFEKEDVYPLDGTGGGAWRELFCAAREFIVTGGSEERPFPPTSNEDYCPLCQQELDDDALSRFQVFNDVVYGKIVAKANEAKEALNKIKERIGALEWSNDLVGEVLCCKMTDEDEDVESDDDEEDLHVLSLWSGVLSSAKEASIGAIESGDEVKGLNVDITSQALSEIKISLATEKLSLLAALDEEERVELENELKLIEARKKLDGKGASILIIRDALLEVEKYNQACTQLGSRKISIIKGKVRSNAFDGPYAQVFNDILKSLDVKVKASIGFKESNAKTYRTLELGKSKAAAKVKIEDVLSEGEHRALALAAFFTEVHHLTGNPAIVIDDPVSSLDHLRRGKVARRIVDLSKTNQVVVFTHDLSFLFDLGSEAANSGQETQVLAVVRTNQGCGVVRNDGPAKIKNAKGRLNDIEQGIIALNSKCTDGVYEEQDERLARMFGGDMRDVLESMVENDLMNGVVRRFGTAVQTQSLREVPIPDDIYDGVTRGMTMTSEWCHEDPQARNRPPPSPQDLLKVIVEIKDLLTLMRVTGKAIKATR